MSQLPQELTQGQIIGFTELTVGGAFNGDPVRAGGSCDLCSTGIRYAAIVKLTDGRTVKLGLTCAQRVGVTVADYWNERRNYSQRASKAEAQARRDAERAAGVDEATANPTDLDLIYTVADAPRGDIDSDVKFVARRLRQGGYVTAAKFAAALTAAQAFELPEMITVEVEALFDLDGNLISTDKGWGNYGPYWRDADGNYYNPSQAKSPKVEANSNAKKGIYVGLVRCEAIEVAGQSWPIALREKGRYGSLANVIEVIDSGAGVEGVAIECQGHCDSIITDAVRHDGDWICRQCHADIVGLARP